MRQIKEEFLDIYYLTEDGKIFNKETEKYLKKDSNNCFKLKREDGKYKKVSLKSLYKKVYNKVYCEDKIDDLSDEIWKEIENCEGKYFVSNKGRIKSYNQYEAFIMKARETNNGYLRIDLIEQGQRVSRLVHRVVASSFLETPKSINMELHHKDFNKKNNNADNLEWLTIAEHKKKHTKGNNVDNEKE